MIDGSLLECIDIANLSAPEKFQGTGQFRRLIQVIAQTAKQNVFIRIENVLNNSLKAHLERNGWDVSSDLGGVSSFYLLASKLTNYDSTCKRKP